MTFWGTREPGSIAVRPRREDEDFDSTSVLLCEFIASDWFEAPNDPRLPATGRLRVEERGYMTCPKCGTTVPYLQAQGVGVIDCRRCKKFMFYLAEGSGLEEVSHG
jgi:hypothetical protein